MKKRTLCRLVGALLALAFVAAPSLATAQQPVTDAARGTARRLAEEGDGLYQAGNFKAAFERFDTAYKVVQVPTIGLMLARTLVKLDRWVEASERYIGVTRLPLPATATDLHAQAQRDAEAENAALMPRIPSVTLRVTNGGADLAVSIDGATVMAALVGAKQLIDPGTHKIEARSGGQVVVAEVTLAEREHKDVPLALPAGTAGVVPTPVPGPVPGPVPAPRPPPAPPEAGPSALTIAGGVTIGLGAAAGVVALGLGLDAVKRKSDLSADTACKSDLQCPPEYHSDASTYNTERIGTTVSLVLGGVALVTGITLVALAPAPQEPAGASADLTLGPGAVGVTGRF
ncbi:MAG: hypothetical protein HY908_36505 [Myxococcales bacterium]|nr:hypothetical protein [Myxococcales bacterium]